MCIRLKDTKNLFKISQLISNFLLCRSEVMLCVSDTLVCDGIRHCPNGNEYDSDEDPELCLRRKSNVDFVSIHSYTTIEQHTQRILIIHFFFLQRNSGNVFHHIAKEIRKIFPPEENTSVLTPPPKMTIVSSTTITSELDTKRENRPSLTRGLSRYGPWGYLMLGMLLCGGALLICGLWGNFCVPQNRFPNFFAVATLIRFNFAECCCRHKKPAIPPDFDASVNAFSTTSDINPTANSSPTGPHPSPQINYDEIDPPPSYAALFPNQKITNESNGISSSAPVAGLEAALPTNI